MVEKPKVGADLADDDDADVQVNFMKMKKKKKKAKKDKAAAQVKAAATTGFDWNIEGHKVYEFAELLDRIENIMNEKMS